MGRDQMRAADADRERVVERLRTALQEGRLELHEFDERLQQAYAAKTYGDLDGLLTDLPVAQPPGAEAPPERRRRPTVEWLVHVWQGWVPAALVLTAIWALSGFGDYWPGWIIGLWGVVLVWRTMSGLMAGAPRRMAEERQARELKEREDKERRALDAEGRAQTTWPTPPTAGPPTAGPPVAGPLRDRPAAGEERAT